MSNLSEAMSASEDIKTQQRFTFNFNLKSRTWHLIYVGWDGYEREVQFKFEKKILGLSQYLVHQDLHDGINIGVYDVGEDHQVADKLLTTLRVDIPNFWPDRDPHQTYSENEVLMIYEALMREAHGQWFQRLSDGWRNRASDEAHAMDFAVNFERE